MPSELRQKFYLIPALAGFFYTGTLAVPAEAAFQWTPPAKSAATAKAEPVPAQGADDAVAPMPGEPVIDMTPGQADPMPAMPAAPAQPVLSEKLDMAQPPAAPPRINLYPLRGPMPVIAPVVPVAPAPLAPPPSVPAMTPVPPPSAPVQLMPAASSPLPEVPAPVMESPSPEPDAPSTAAAPHIPVNTPVMMQPLPAPMMAAAPAASTASFDQAVGFGRDMPLAIAMSQIVPAAYSYNFAAGVDAGQRITWQGGAPWNEVLMSALEPAGLKVFISGQSVMVAPAAMPPRATAPQAPTGSMMMAPAAAAPAAMMPEPDRTADLMPAAAYPAPLSEMTPSPEMPAPAPVAPGVSTIMQASYEMPPAEEMPAPLVPMMPPAAGMMAMPPAQVPAAIPVKPFEPAMGLSPDPDRPPAAMEMAGADEVPAAKAEVMGEMPVRAAPARPYDPGLIEYWTAEKGSSLRQTLLKWTEEASVELQWASDFDYPLQSGVRLKGTFEQAVETLMAGLMEAQPRPLGRLHPNYPDGPAVLVIETRHVIQ